MNKNLLLLCFFIVISIFGYKTSIATKEQFKKVYALNSSLEKESNKSNVLVADWTYLNRFERLDKLAETHLNLTSVKPNQILQLSNSINFAEIGFNYKIAMITPTKKPKRKLT